MEWRRIGGLADTTVGRWIFSERLGIRWKGFGGVMLCYAVTMGSDFQFEHAFVNSKSLDLHVLIDPINSMERI